MGHCWVRGQLRCFSGRVEESGPDSGGWGAAEEPLFTVETALEQAHFSTVFVALLGGGGGVQGFLRAASLPRPHGAQPCVGLQQETHVFVSQVLLGSMCRLGCTETQDVTPPAATATGTQHTSCCQQLSTQEHSTDHNQAGRFPTKWNCSRSMMPVMPDDHCTLVTSQTRRQPQRLGAKEGFHCLLEDALALILVSCPRSHESSLA